MRNFSIGTACLPATLLFVSLFIIVDAQAQVKPDTTITFREIVVTATRYEKPVSKIGRAISLISNDDINSTGVNNTSELLSRLPSVFIVGNNQNLSSLNNLFLRGASNNQVSILIDGAPVFDPASPDRAFDLSELSLMNVQQIEVIRGSHSALYGSSSIGGVVNVITKKNTGRGLTLQGSATGGTFKPDGRLFSNQLQADYGFGNGIYFGGGFSSVLSGGFDSTVRPEENNGFELPDQGDDYTKTDALLKAGYSKDNLQAELRYKNIYRDFDIDDGAFSDDENHTTDTNRDIIHFSGKYNFSNLLNLSLNADLSFYDRSFKDDSSLTDAQGNTDQSFSSGEFGGDMFYGELQNVFKGSGFSTVLGTSVLTETLEQETFFTTTAFGGFESSTNLDSLDIYGSLFSVFTYSDFSGSLLSPKLSRLNLGAGLRYLNHNDFGSEWVYEINPSIQLTNELLVYASHSTGFNTPSLFQLNAPNVDFTSGITLGNSELDPETSSSLEAGVKFYRGERFKAEVGMFRTVIKDGIEFVNLWNGDKPIDQLGFGDFRGNTYLNVAEQENTGIEINAELLIFDNLSVYGNMSLIDGTLSFEPEDIDESVTQGNTVQLFTGGNFVTNEQSTSELVRRPNTYNVGLDYTPFEQLNLNTNVRIVDSRNDISFDNSLGPFGALGKQPVDRYTLVDVSAEYQLSSSFSVYIQFENILDEEYQEIQGFRTKGRSFYTTIRFYIN